MENVFRFWPRTAPQKDEKSKLNPLRGVDIIVTYAALLGRSFRTAPCVRCRRYCGDSFCPVFSVHLFRRYPIYTCVRTHSFGVYTSRRANCFPRGERRIRLFSRNFIISYSQRMLMLNIAFTVRAVPRCVIIPIDYCIIQVSFFCAMSR